MTNKTMDIPTTELCHRCKIGNVSVFVDESRLESMIVKKRNVIDLKTKDIHSVYTMYGDNGYAIDVTHLNRYNPSSINGG